LYLAMIFLVSLGLCGVHAYDYATLIAPKRSNYMHVFAEIYLFALILSVLSLSCSILYWLYRKSCDTTGDLVKDRYTASITILNLIAIFASLAIVALFSVTDLMDVLWMITPILLAAGGLFVAKVWTQFRLE